MLALAVAACLSMAAAAFFARQVHRCIWAKDASTQSRLGTARFSAVASLAAVQAHQGEQHGLTPYGNPMPTQAHRVLLSWRDLKPGRIIIVGDVVSGRVA
jgi:hypothetical protein